MASMRIQSTEQKKAKETNEKKIERMLMLQLKETARKRRTRKYIYPFRIDAATSADESFLFEIIIDACEVRRVCVCVCVTVRLFGFVRIAKLHLCTLD